MNCSNCEHIQCELKKKDVALTTIKNQKDHVCDCDYVSELKSNDGSYTAPVRLCVCELIGLEVSADNVPRVIQSVSNHIFNHEFDLGDLPCRNTCINIANEGGEVIKNICAKRLGECSAWGLHKDGTTRKKQKILDASITLPSGEEFNLGFSRAASETSQTICTEVVDKLNELSAHSENPDKFLQGIAGSLAYCMNNRAANEKKSNELLSEWRDSMVKQHPGQRHQINSLYCMAHVLLGFQTYILKELEIHQKTISTDGSGNIGRDKAFKRSNAFKSLQAASRTCKSASEVFAPVGDFRGLRDVWEAYCKKNNISSTICNYRDNRFNGMFAVSSSIVHHHQDFLHILNSTTQDNAIIRGLKADLQDEDLMDILHALALVYVKITDPYWNMVTSVAYAKVIHPIRSLYNVLLQALEQPTLLMTNESISCLQPWLSKKSPFSSPTVKCHILKPVIQGLVKCFQKQLKDILDATDESLAALNSTPFAPSTNLCVERSFGDLDASQHRRPNASLHYHSSFINLKKHYPKLSSHIRSMTKLEQRMFYIKMRYLAKKHRLKHKKDEEAVGQLILQKLRHQAQRPKLLKSAREISKRKIKRSAPLLPLPKISDISQGTWVAVSFHDSWYPGIVKSLAASNVEVDFAYPCKTHGDFKWPDGKDLHEIHVKCIIGSKLPISVRSNGRFLHVENHREILKLHQRTSIV